MKTCLILLFSVFLSSPLTHAQSELDNEPSVKNFERAVLELPPLIVLRARADGQVAFTTIEDHKASEKPPQDDWVFTEVKENVPYSAAHPAQELDQDAGRESWFFSYRRCCGPAGAPYFPRYYYYGYYYNYVYYQAYFYVGYYYYYFRPYYWWW